MSTVWYHAHTFDIPQAQSELNAFKRLLGTSAALAERRQVLASFANWPQLCSLFGSYHPRIRRADLVKRELKVGAHFGTDLAVRRAGTDNVCLVEFEGASENDIFSRKLNGRRIPPWASAMEKGFSQIVDWAWALDTHRDLPEFQDAFGSKRPNVIGVLVIGRSASLADATSRDRWLWRSQCVQVNALRGVHLQTFDELYTNFDIELKVMSGATTAVTAGPAR